MSKKRSSKTRHPNRYHPSFAPNDDSDWNTRRSCSSISHSYHHKCSRCGSKDHGAQNCSQTQKESLSHRMKLNCGTFVSWRDDFTIFHRSHCYGNISMILLTSASPPPLPPVHPRPYYEHYIETLAQRRQDLRRKLLTLQPAFPSNVPAHPLVIIDFKLIRGCNPQEIDKPWEAATKLVFWW